MWKILSKNIIKTLLKDRNTAKYRPNNTKNHEFQSPANLSYSSLSKATLDVNDDMTEHVMPHICLEKMSSKTNLSPKFKMLLNCSDKDLKKINFIPLKGVVTTRITDRIKYLLEMDIDQQSIIDNFYLLVMEIDKLNMRLSILHSIQPKHIKDFIPLLSLPDQQFNRAIAVLQEDASQFTEGNRIYYFGEKFKVAPQIVSKIFAENFFLLEMKSSKLKAKVEIYVEYDVEPEHILRRIKCFTASASLATIRFQRVREVYPGPLMPWMVMCSERAITKSLKIIAENRLVLGQNKSVVDYLSKRLSYSKKVIECAVGIYPSILSVRLRNLQTLLNFLLSESRGYTNHDIVQSPKILYHGLYTTQKRMDHLKREFNYRATSLWIFTCSLAEYRKHINKWELSGKIIRSKKPT